MTKLEELLTSIGVAKETIEALNKEPEEGSEPIDVKPYADAIKANFREVFTNDPDFINPIKQSITGKERGTIENQLKGILTSNGVNDEELASFNGYKDYIGKLGEVIESSKNHNADSEKLQAELIAANKRAKELEEVTLPKIQAEAEAKIKGFVVGTKLKEKVAGFELIVPNNVADTIISDKLSKLGLNADLSDDGSIKLLTSEGTEALNASRDGILTVDEFVKGTLEESKIIKQSNGGGTPTPSPAPINGTERVKGMPHIDKV